MIFIRRYGFHHASVGLDGRKLYNDIKKTAPGWSFAFGVSNKIHDMNFER